MVKSLVRFIKACAILLGFAGVLQAVRDTTDMSENTIEVRLIANTTPAALSYTNAELEVIRPFTPQRIEVDMLPLAVGDRIKVSHDPGENSKNAHYVFGRNQDHGGAGWFPVRHTAPVGGSLIETQDPCKDTYFGDWGSSGMKLYQVHKGINTGAAEPTGNPETLSSGTTVGDKVFLGHNLDDDQTRAAPLVSFSAKIEEKCVALDADHTFADHSMIIFATAGLRLIVRDAEFLWGALQQLGSANDKTCKDKFWQCNTDDPQQKENNGCKTLPGNVEALYEMSAYLMWLKTGPLGLISHVRIPLDKKKGWISAGGASLQIGFFEEDDSDQKFEMCINAMTAVWAGDVTAGDVVYDELPGRIRRTRDTEGGRVLTFSFLSVAGDQQACDLDPSDNMLASQDYCDHRVGGVNQMRQRFEEFLHWQNKKAAGETYDKNDKNTWIKYSKNPCLEVAISETVLASKPFKYPKDSQVDTFADTMPGGLSFDGADSNEKALEAFEKCKTAVNDFILSDLSVQAWIKPGNGCLDAAKPVEQWGLMTSYSRNIEFHRSSIGADHGDWMKGKACTVGGANDYLSDYKCGGLYTNVLLTRLFETLGFDIGDTLVMADKDEVAWIKSPMKLHGLGMGWCTA